MDCHETGFVLFRLQILSYPCEDIPGRANLNARIFSHFGIVKKMFTIVRNKIVYMGFHGCK